MTQQISKQYPIISLSTEPGYKRAITRADRVKAKHCLNELISRGKEILERTKPIIEFLDLVDSGLSDEQLKTYYNELWEKNNDKK